MSSNYGEKREFKCWHDCTQLGCPGHTIQARYSNTSDTLSIYIDGKSEYSFDPDTWKAMKLAANDVGC